MPRAVADSGKEVALPLLIAMLCVLAVFLPSFFMVGAAKGLFVPLSLAVGFSMVTSYILAGTLVNVMAIWLLKAHSKSRDLIAPAAIQKVLQGSRPIMPRQCESF